MNTVIAAVRVQRRQQLRGHDHRATIARGQTKHYFFRVPAGTPAFKVDMTGGGRGRCGRDPVPAVASVGARRSTRTRSSNCYNAAPGGCTTGSATEPDDVEPAGRRLGGERSMHGGHSDAYPAPAPFTLTATILGASVSPNPDVIASATVGVPVARSYTMTNLFGAFTGRAVGSNMGSAFRARPTIANLAVQADAGGRACWSHVTSRDDRQPVRPGSRPRPLRLQLHDGDLRPRRAERGRRLRGVGDDRQPGSGARGRSSSTASTSRRGTTTYKYIDVYFKTAALGAISVTDANALRPAGASWTVPGSVTANASAGYRPGALRQRQRA